MDLVKNMLWVLESPNQTTNLCNAKSKGVLQKLIKLSVESLSVDFWLLGMSILLEHWIIRFSSVLLLWIFMKKLLISSLVLMLLSFLPEEEKFINLEKICFQVQILRKISRKSLNSKAPLNRFSVERHASSQFHKTEHAMVGVKIVQIKLQEYRDRRKSKIQKYWKFQFTWISQYR